MGQLKDQMLMEMRLRNFSPSTIKAYVWYVANFTKHFGKIKQPIVKELKNYREAVSFNYYMNDPNAML